MSHSTFTASIEKEATVSTSIGLTFKQLQLVFPFHIRINSNFIITQVGSRLGSLFPLNQQTNEPMCIGKYIGDIFVVVSPTRFIWDYKRLKIGQNMTYSLDLKDSAEIPIKRIPLIGGVIISNSVDDPSCQELSALFLFNLRIKHSAELQEMGLTWSSISQYGFQKELMLTAEHLQSEVVMSHKLEKIKKSLEEERSKTLVRAQVIYYIILYHIILYCIDCGSAVRVHLFSLL